MRQGSRSPDRARRIRDIVQQITELSDELQNLILADDPPAFLPEPPPRPPPRPPSPPQPVRSNNPHSTGYFLAGDRIEINNTRNGLRGFRGTVHHTNNRFVFFTLDSTGDIVWRSPRNLRRLHPPPR